MEKIEKIIEEIKQKARENLVPIVRDKTLNHLNQITATIQPKKVLEIGTAVGYSGLNMLHYGAKHLTTIEKNDERYSSALQNFEMADVKTRVRAIKGDAIDVLQNLKEEDEKFDLVFLDGPKGQYIRYLPFIKELLADGACLFADNVGVLGLVEHAELVTHKNRTMVRNMQAFLKDIQNDDSLSVEIFDVDDGYAVCYYNQKNDRKD